MANAAGQIGVLDLTDSSSQGIFWTGHKADVQALSWHPNGAVFATGSHDGSVHIWAFGRQSEPLVSVTVEGVKRIQALSFSQTGKELFVATNEPEAGVLIYGADCL